MTTFPDKLTWTVRVWERGRKRREYRQPGVLTCYPGSGGSWSRRDSVAPLLVTIGRIADFSASSTPSPPLDVPPPTFHLPQRNHPHIRTSITGNIPWARTFERFTFVLRILSCGGRWGWALRWAGEEVGDEEGAVRLSTAMALSSRGSPQHS